jgi:hypothetical protein
MSNTSCVGARTVEIPRARRCRGIVGPSALGTLAGCSFVNIIASIFVRPLLPALFWLTIGWTIPILVIAVVVELTLRASIAAAARYSRHTPGKTFDLVALIAAFAVALLVLLLLGDEYKGAAAWLSIADCAASVTIALTLAR